MTKITVLCKKVVKLLKDSRGLAYAKWWCDHSSGIFICSSTMQVSVPHSQYQEAIHSNSLRKQIILFMTAITV